MGGNMRDYNLRRRRLSAVLLLTLLVITYTIASHLLPVLPEQTEAPANTPEIVTSELATKALDTLPVRERVTGADYDRNLFSPDWADIAGCDMRNRILQRDLVNVTLDEDNCTVLSGILENDPYTGREIPFQRGAATSGDIQIDHVVAVSDAWMKGAKELSYEQRQDFYNDPLNLLAVSGEANIEKGNSDAAKWLPRQGYRCRYVARQIAVKLKYLLWATLEEERAMRRTLSTCPDQRLPQEISNEAG